MVKLYPSIPKKEGLSACEKALSVTNNTFEFHYSEYIQNDAVAIGSNRVLLYAQIGRENDVI